MGRARHSPAGAKGRYSAPWCPERDRSQYSANGCEGKTEPGTLNIEGLMLHAAEAPILWTPDADSRLIGKDPDAGKD